MPLLIQLIVVLAIVGLLLWVLSQFPIDPVIMRIIRVVVIVVVCLYLLQLLVSAFGGYSLFPNPRYR